MKTAFLFLSVLFFQLSSLASTVIPQDVLIDQPQFVNLIQNAYKGEWTKQPDGSFVFANLLKCDDKRCWLLKGAWAHSDASTVTRNVMYTPVTEDAVLDLLEYMKVPFKTEKVDGAVVRSKKIEFNLPQKSYSLNCANAISPTGQILLSQCVLLNGIMQ